MKLLFAFVAFVAVVMVWAMWGRNWLKSKPWPWAVKFFAWIEPIEIMLWKKSETIFAARAKMLIGVLLTVLTQLGTIDLTPLMPFVPDKYEGMVKLAFNLLPLVITVVGMMDEKLRNETNTPLAIVALPDKVIAESPKIAEAVAAAESAKVEAVAVVETVVAEKKAEAVIENAAVAADAAAVSKPKDGD